MANDHVIAATTGYAVSDVALFARSLDQVGFDGTLHVIVTPRDRSLADELGRLVSYRVRPWVFRRPRTQNGNRAWRLVQYVPFFGGTSRPNGIKFYVLQRALPVSSLRYLAAQRMVEELTDDAVFLLTDSRDVYFQSNPFSHYREEYAEKLVLSLETPPINPENITYRWIRDVYGRQIADSLNGRPVSCSGTTMGDKHRISAYLGSMVHEITSHRTAISHTVGYDQGIHNYLLYAGRLSEFVTPPNGSGPFFVVQQDPVFDDRGRVCDDRGHVVPVVHQYDRSKGWPSRSDFFTRLRADALVTSEEQCVAY